ncbi:hypothetical protein XACG102_10850009 [Xanthomonas citri pv. citri]|nr:hypothetical protein XACG102_10850009 [Xanthomonas citri pv. citri]
MDIRTRAVQGGPDPSNAGTEHLGGDDFAEYFDPKDGVFDRMLHSADDLILSATATHLSLEVVPSA